MIIFSILVPEPKVLNPGAKKLVKKSQLFNICKVSMMTIFTGEKYININIVSRYSSVREVQLTAKQMMNKPQKLEVMLCEMVRPSAKYRSISNNISARCVIQNIFISFPLPYKAIVSSFVHHRNQPRSFLLIMRSFLSFMCYDVFLYNRSRTNSYLEQIFGSY